MDNQDFRPPEESLDPADWDAMRALGHRMVDDMLTFLQTVRERPVWQPIPSDVKDFLHQPLPQESQGAQEAYRDFVANVLPHPMGNIHPRFWGWVIGTGTPFGMLAEMLAAGMNPNVGGGDHVANYVEAQVIDWCKEMLGYSPQASGLLVSGGSMANLVGLTVARNAQAGFDIRKQGLTASPRRLVMYASREAHSSIQKSVELLGLGNESLRQVPVNADFQIDLRELKNAIAQDRAAGHQPICIIGNAGTVNTGAIDDLNALADIAAREHMWFHVDGAFGALASMSPQMRAWFAGIDRADSLAFDLHKWMYMPIEVGCALVKNESAHRHAFALSPDYLTHAERGLEGGNIWFSEYGVQLSRGFRALKVWLSLKEHGIQKYVRLIEQNVAQAQYLAQLVDAAPDLERLAPAPLNIVCFRYRVNGMDDPALNQFNQELLMRLQESGVAAPSHTMLNGKYAIRAAITNHRSRREDFELLVKQVIHIGKTMTES
jgi:aromatic-L-amino-acid/L-tryptophan decarboxylase